MDENAKELQKREERLFNKKANLDALNQELALNFRPERADFTTDRALGEEFAIDLFDSEPLRCRRDLGNARASMLRPAGRDWCRAETTDSELNEGAQISRFLDLMNKRFRTMIYQPDSGFVRAEKEADQDIVTFGNAVKTAESEIDRNGKRILMIRDWHLRDCAWLDDANGVRQDFMARRFKASARHIKQKFPDASLHDSIKTALENDPDTEFKLCHTMMRADEYTYQKKPRGRKAPWVSVYYDSEHRMLLRERPSQRFRYVVDRWETLPGCQYAYSPAAMTALPDGRGIQTMVRVLYESGEKSLDPPLQVTRGAVRGQVDQSAGAIVWKEEKYDERLGAAIEPLLPNDRNIQIGIDLINRVTQALRDTWYLTKLTLPQQAKTAYETAQLVEEFIRANIPLFEPWEAGIGMMLDEIFEVLIEMGAFGSMADWPPELSNNSLVFKFSNPLQDAIERNKVNQATTVIGLLAGISKVDPNAPGAKRVDLDEMAEAATRGTGAPADWIKSEDQLKADAEAQQAQQQQGDIVGALHGAGMAADVANSGLEAAAKLRELNQPAADQSAVYGPT